MKYAYISYENAVASELCEQLLLSFGNDNFTSGTVGVDLYENVNISARSTEIQWAPKCSLIESILTRFILQANQDAFWNFDITEPEQVQIAKYSETHFYNQHMDCYVEEGKSSQRKISASLLLNKENEYEGGDLIVLNDVIQTKKQGTIIVFPSFMAHQVTPITKGVRYSAVCWMSGPKWK
jgi:PKHD-type hydroxylase